MLGGGVHAEERERNLTQKRGYVDDPALCTPNLREGVPRYVEHPEHICLEMVPYHFRIHIFDRP
jgi:hypothetical protein